MCRWWQGLGDEEIPPERALELVFFFQHTPTHTKSALYQICSVYNENRADLWENFPVGCYFGTRCDRDICQARQARYLLFHSRLLQHVAAYYSMLQSVAVCCSVLQCVAVCCSVLQCVAVCCSVLQCVAVCCSVCCSVLHCVAVFNVAICRVWQARYLSFRIEVYAYPCVYTF